MDCKTFTFVDVNAHQLTFDTFDLTQDVVIFLRKIYIVFFSGMFCKTLPSAPVSLILYQRISKGSKLDLASSCLTKRHLCKEERLKKMHSHLTISNNLSATKFQFGFLHSRFHLLAHGVWWVPIIHSNWHTFVLFLYISAYLLQIFIGWVSILYFLC